MTPFEQFAASRGVVPAEPLADTLAAGTAPAPDVAMDGPQAPAEPDPAPVAPAEPSAAAGGAPEAIQAAPAAQAVFVPGRERSKTIQLDWPVVFAGVRYDAIVLGRPTARQVGDFYEALLARLEVDPAAKVLFPVYFDTAGRPLPEEVLAGLDDDDMQVILGEVDGFLPKRLRPMDKTPEDNGSGSNPGTGDATEPKSGE